jgi:hypothetical protein
MVHYAGENPVSEDMMWMDTLFGMGKLMFELVPGLLYSQPLNPYTP